jgi:broad specificity phosphatase PhoE
VSQYDHELTSDGIDQAISFNARWKACRDKRDSGEALSADDLSDIETFLAAEALFASPLTRATQTALLTCKDHPRLLPASDGAPKAATVSANMTLLRNIREVKNVGSFDTVGSLMGDGISEHVREMLARDLGEERANKILPSALVIDFNEAVGPWWTPLEVKESHDDVRMRFNELWAFLRYGVSANKIILVGHSHFFRFMMKEYMSDAFKATEPQWTSQLSSGKLDNGACIRVAVAWENAADPMAAPAVNSGRLVFGSKLIIEEEKKGSARSMLSGIMSGKRQDSPPAPPFATSPTAAAAAALGDIVVAKQDVDSDIRQATAVEGGSAASANASS